MNEIKLTSDLSFVTIPVKHAEVVEVKMPTNHVLVIDCSGSMAGELPKIRHQLKNKLPNLVLENDTVSLVWFSGREQCGMLAERVVVKNIEDLERLNKSIDRWLQPIGMTGFVEPLDKVLDLATNVTGLYSLFFLTDGYDNQWGKGQILTVCEKLSKYVAGAVFVEYGWNCNRPLMTEMASQVGGNLVFCEDFDAYEPIITASLGKSLKSSKKIAIEVKDPLFGVVYSISEMGPCAYAVCDNKVYVPECVDAIYYYTVAGTGVDIKAIDSDESLLPLYHGVYLLTQRMKSTVVRQILAALGDKKLFNKYANCFGKQNNTDFQTLALETAKGKKFTEGRAYDLKIDENAFTVLDLLFMLSKDDENLLYTSKMKYNKIGRSTKPADLELTEAEMVDFEEMASKAKTVSDLAKISEKANELVNSRAPLKFNYASKDVGYPVTKLVWNENRPNVSVLVKIDGTVELPDSEFVIAGTIPKVFPTYIYRNYTIIRDGLVNVDELPLKLTRDTFLALKGLGLVSGDYVEDQVYLVNIRNLPTINQNMVKTTRAKDLFAEAYALLKLKAAQKVYKAFKTEWLGEKVSEGFKELYGEASATWLTEIGITDYSGFSPKVTLKESVDFYVGVELDVIFKNLTSIPSFNAVVKKLVEGKKLTPREALLEEAYNDCVNYAKSVDGKINKAELLKEWIIGKEKEIVKNTRMAQKRIAELKFSVIVGQVWFEEFETINDNTMELEFDGNVVQCTAELKDVEIKI